MTDPAAEAARSATVILTPDLGRNLPAEVEAPLAARAGDHRPDRKPSRITSPGGSSLPGSWCRPGSLSLLGPAS